MFQRPSSTRTSLSSPIQVKAPDAAPTPPLSTSDQDALRLPARHIADEKRHDASDAGRLLAPLMSPSAIPFLFLYCGIYGLYFYITYNQVFSVSEQRKYFVSDLPAHLTFAAQYFHGHYVTPEPGLYILWGMGIKLLGLTLAQSAIVIDPLLVVAVAVIIHRALAASGFSAREQLLFTTVLMIVTPIYDPFFGDLYLGQFSSTIYHNPTLFAVKPFAYLSLLLLVKAFDRPNAVALYVWAALAIAVSIVMKPNFVLVFAPALGVLLLLRARRLEQWWKMGLICLIIAACLAFQYLVTYGQPDSSNHVVWNVLGVWRLYSFNPAYSTLLSIAFPLFVLLARWRSLLHNNYLLLAWLTFLIALAQWALLAEAGTRFVNGNFEWGAQIAVAVLFLCSLVEWRAWARSLNTRLALVMWCVPGLALSLHVVSGAWYLMHMASGGLYY